MKILIATSALPTHYFPMVPFGWACATAGHEVMVAHSPGLGEAVLRSGLRSVPVGADVDFAQLHRQTIADLKQDGRGYDPKILFSRVAESMVEDLVALARNWRPDAVVWDPATFAGPVAAAACGATSVRWLWGPDIVGRGRAGWEGMPREFPALFERFGLDPGEHAGHLTADPCPVGMAVPEPSGRVQSVRYVPYAGQCQVPLRPAASGDRPRLLVTMGTSTARLMGEEPTAAKFARALAGLDVDVVLAIPPAEREPLGELPANVEALDSCPLDSLVPGCDLVVHHGGSGTMLTAALHGVPQLMVPRMPDLKFNAIAFESTGVSRHLAGSAAEPDPDQVRAAAEELLGSASFREAALGVSEQLRKYPAPSALAGDLESLVA